MSITDIIIRSMSGYIFVVPIIVFYVLEKIRKKANKNPYLNCICVLLLPY